MNTVHVVVPGNIDDVARPSGGNVYDRRLCHALTSAGWQVQEHSVPGSWPRPTDDDLAVLDAAVAGIPDGAAVLIDGLVASTARDVLVPVADRLRVVVLVHMPLGDASPDSVRPDAASKESAVLSRAAAVVTPSAWTRDRLIELYSLPRNRLHVAEPGVEPSEPAPGTARGGELLCVAAVTPNKGYDVLIAALAMLGELPWRCTCVGSLDLDPGFVERLRGQAREDGLGDRLVFTGALTGPALDAAYARADLLVLASRAETFGMVVTEALARGVPVVATAVGGLPQALGGSPAGTPGLLVPPDEPARLAEALCGWLTHADVRERLREAARQRRDTLTGWSVTAEQIARVITEVT